MMPGYGINDLMVLHFAHADFKISDQDVDSGDPDITYYGYVNRVGEWYIMRRDNSPASGDDRAYRFVKGGSGFATGWSGRQGLSYEAYDTCFR